MSGLLDKANEYKDSVHQGDNVGSKVVNDPSAIISAYEMGKKSAEKETKVQPDPKPVKKAEPEKKPVENKKTPSPKPDNNVATGGGGTGDNAVKWGDNDKKIIIGMQIAAVIFVLFSLFKVLQDGWIYATITDRFLSFLIIAIGWGLYAGSNKLSDNFTTLKAGFSAIVLVVVYITASIGTMFIVAGGGVTIASVELDGSNNELDLKFFGPTGMDYSVEIVVDGAVSANHESTINVDRGSHSVPLVDFWIGNSEDMAEDKLLTYEVVVTSEGGVASFDFSHLMNREVDTGFVRINEKFTTDTETGEKTYTGITVELIIGMGDPDASFGFDNNMFTGVEPKPVESDWTVGLKVLKGSSETYSYDTITAEEGIVPGLGEFSYSWVQMPGTYSNDISILDRDDFYSGDGCYIFEVKIINDLGETYTNSDSRIEFFWDSNEGSQDSEPASEC